jgi:DNA-3-methyladenine glycosylase
LPAHARRATTQEPEALGVPLPPEFFRRSSLAVARELLGLLLCHETEEGLVAGRIVEVEAYKGPRDLAAHSAGGRRTPRNEVMYADGGCAYVYFVYGMHYCMNVVAATREVPEAVLLRAVEPTHGVELMRARRGSDVATPALARGPGNLARAFAIDRQHNGLDLRTSALRIVEPLAAASGGGTGAEVDLGRAGRDIVRSPRIGVAYAGLWAAKPWRFSLRDNRSVSRPPRP